MTTVVRFCRGMTLVLGLSSACVAADYSVNWSTIDGSGGTSSGGVFTVTGTIGQPDAGTLSGGGFTLSGGFWGIIAAVQNEGAPWLTITETNHWVTVSWPRPATGWLLENTNRVVGLAVAWPPVPLPYQTNASTIWVTFPNSPPVGNAFFRLRKQ